MLGFTVIFIAYFMNVVTFFLFANDKHRAIYGERRIPEWVLMSCTLLGGSFGALMGMWMFRHKTLHSRFRVLVPASLLIHTCLLYVMGYIINVLPSLYQ